MTQHEALNAIGYGLGAINLERARQVKIHEWTPAHDDQYTNRELLRYAEYWMTSPFNEDTRVDIQADLQMESRAKGTNGWEDEWFKYDQKTPEERLARAGALIAAEIDRLHRASKKESK